MHFKTFSFLVSPITQSRILINAMASKSLGVAVILVLLPYMSLVVVAIEGMNLDANGDDNDVLYDCKQQCMSICLKIKLAQVSLCQEACSPACKQLKGKGSFMYL